MKGILTSIWFIALIVASIIISFMPPLFQKYILEPVLTKPYIFKDKLEVTDYADIHNTGEKSRIMAYKLKQRDKNNTVISYAVDRPMIRFYGESLPSTTHLFFGDTNGNGFNEIIGFSQSGDSLVINKIEPANLELTDIPASHHCFVPELEISKRNFRYIYQGLFADVDKDGFDEFVFILPSDVNGFSFSICVFDAQNNTVNSTKIMKGRPLNLYAFDFNGDGCNEIVASAEASIPDPKSKAKNNNSSYFLTLSKAPELKVETVKLSGNWLHLLPSKEGNKNFLYTLYCKQHASGNSCVLYKFNSNKTITDSLKLKIDRMVPQPAIGKINNKEIFIQVDKGKIYFANNQLKLINEEKLDEESTYIYIYYSEDINEDGVMDFLCIDYQSLETVLFTDKFKNKLPVANSSGNKSLGNFKIEKNQFFFPGKNNTTIFNFKKNPVRYFQYPIYVAIYLLIVLLGYIFRKTQEFRLKETYELRNKVLNLQLQNIQNQLDPHFTFNVLNSVGNAIYKQDKEAAYDLFQRFTRIIRSSLMSSDKVFRTLKEELQFTQDYLELQKLRFKDRFNYSIKTDKTIDTHSIRFPKMLIQGFAENAVKHAFHGVDYTGQISINVSEDTRKLKITIEDNGIGIKCSKELKTTSGTQKGSTILQEQVKHINRIYGTEYSISVIDKNHSEANENGTLITISLFK